MSESEMFWFHCGRCGSLFQSQVGDLEDRFCTKCGAKPGLDIVDPQRDKPIPSTKTSNDADTPRPARRKETRSRAANSNKLLIKIVCGWLLFLVLIVMAARWIWQEDPAPQNVVAATGQKAPEMGQEDIKLLEDAYSEYSAVFNGFLASATPEEQNQYVINAASTATKAARFYSSNPLIKIDQANTSLTHSTVLALPDGKAIATLWNNQDGRKFDVIFRKENGEWKIDWEHFSRYSTEPWVLFLSGVASGEGEFRLLARERLAEERKSAEDISLILYSPRFGNPGDVGFPSPEILVKRDSTEGKLLTAAFQQISEGKSVFGSTLPKLDPDDMIRVRAVIRRSQTDNVTRFEISRIIACHWYSIDHPGVE